MTDKINGSEEERQVAIERVRKARVGVAQAMGIFTRDPNKERTAEENAAIDAAKKELDAATAELVRIQGNAEVGPRSTPGAHPFGAKK